jgi:transcriptional regulator with XRE-family HTH domain
MNPVAIGRSVRALRHRKRWRQLDLAVKVGIGQSVVSRVEAGDLDRVSVSTLERLLSELGAELAMYVRWHGGDLDRLLDEAHAGLVERVARLLRRLGWQVLVEVSYNRWGERGSVDILAWHADTRTVLVVEVKSEIAAVEETLRKHDAKVRLAPAILHERMGERPTRVARLLVLPDTSTTRRRLAVHDATFTAAYPTRGRPIARWLRRPDGAMAGVLLIPGDGPRTARRRRINAPAA